MNKEKLEKLRSRYSEAAGDDIFDPKFKRAAQSQFSAGRRSKPYSGLPTFLDAPYQEGLSKLDVAIIGIPMDLGVTNRPGARFGPRALRTIERVGPYNHYLDVVPFSVLDVADIGDVDFRSRFSLHDSLEDIETFYKKIHDANVFPLSVGGDHSVTYPIMKAIGANEPVGMIHIDAHCDTAGEYEGTKFQHGAPFRQAVLAGVLDPDRCIQIGIRGTAEYLWEFSYESGMTVVHAEDITRRGIPDIIKQARQVVGDGPVYVTFDVDGLDPTYAPGTGTPEVGGLTPRETQELLRGLAGLNVIGGDVVEVAPQYDANTTTALVGAQMLFEILSLMALSPAILEAKNNRD